MNKTAAEWVYRTMVKIRLFEEEVERLLLAHSPRFQAILQTAERQIRDGQGIYHADFWKEAEEDFPKEGK
jgi:predicted transcriptional regulator